MSNPNLSLALLATPLPRYQHFDVQPALKSDGWDTEPFKLVHDEKTGRLYGRGSTDDKGPVLGWINVMEAHKQAG